MSVPDPSKQERIEEFLRKSLLGEELINTQFHLFSARSSASGRVAKPRVLCANNVLLAKSSKYFLDLLSSDISPSDPSLSDLTDDNDMPNDLPIDKYGYANDSDLDDEDEADEDKKLSIPKIKTDAPKVQPAAGSTTPTTEPKDDDELSDDGSESVSSDMFVMSPEHPKLGEPFTLNVNGTSSVASSETAIQETPGSGASARNNNAAMRLRSLGSRHVLVKDTAFQTWYALLNYLYTGKISFLPLGSVGAGGQFRGSSMSSLDVLQCSAKSMYHLAYKVGLDDLRDQALAHIRSNLSKQNVLKELSSTLVSKHSELLEMELDMLYSHIASPPVVTGFPALAQRISHGELPHGAEIIVGIHKRVLKDRQPEPGQLPSIATVALEPPSTEGSPSPLTCTPSVPLVDSPSRPTDCGVSAEYCDAPAEGETKPSPKVSKDIGKVVGRPKKKKK